MEQLALYDRYGSMAYGIILQIIPQSQQAQAVLVDLFASSELQNYTTPSSNVAMAIIRMARSKALEAKARTGAFPHPVEPDKRKASLPEIVFDMAFRQGYSVDAVADSLQLAKKDVLKAIRDYSISFRQA